jgi:hypothetical protein
MTKAPVFVPAIDPAKGWRRGRVANDCPCGALQGAGFSVLTYNSVTGDLVEQETVLSTGTYNASAQCWGTCVIQMATFRAAIQ